MKESWHGKTSCGGEDLAILQSSVKEKAGAWTQQSTGSRVCPETEGCVHHHQPPTGQEDRRRKATGASGLETSGERLVGFLISVKLSQQQRYGQALRFARQFFLAELLKKIWTGLPPNLTSPVPATDPCPQALERRTFPAVQ